MLKELNSAFGALCSTTSTTAKALESGSKILLIKGEAAKQIAALEAVKNIAEAKKGCDDDEIKAANELLTLVE